MATMLHLFSRRAMFADNEIDLVLSRDEVTDEECGIEDGYLFRMYHKKDYAGYISLRLGESPGLYYLGHIGYRVEPEYRGRGYALRACNLIVPLLKQLRLSNVVITTDVDNHPSRRVCEKLGCELERVAPVPPEYRKICSGSMQKCRYIWKIDLDA